MRQIVLDTETTGLEPKQGHRIIEIGCVEMVNRRLTGNTYHQYINPEREVDQGAVEVHGITNEMLADKPTFREIAAEFMAFVDGAELVIHNAPFDTGFLNHELRRLRAEGGTDFGTIEAHCEVTDTLALARRMHPGQKNNLDALCKRYDINNSHRELHGALLDSEILADVYRAMTGGQKKLSLDGESDEGAGGGEQVAAIRRLPADRPRLKVVRASGAELEAHAGYLEAIDKASGGNCLWNRG
ncbi:DNA polymerase III subunit epsilon [Endothiovibrio diazotrophicus]